MPWSSRWKRRWRRRAVSEARRLGVATDFIAEHPTLPTGTVNVTLDASGVPSYEIASPSLPDGPVVDTVGAGDAFSAAFLAAVLRGESLQAAAEAGNRLAGRVAARPGAIPEDL